MTFRELFSKQRQLVIPLIQRRYCWHGETVWKWFEDVVRGKRDHIGNHNTGNIVLKKSDEQTPGFIVIDGQQRITTTMLFITAVRDELKKLLDTCKKLEVKITQVLNEIQDILFVEKSQSIARLLPSFYDRRPFTNILTSESEGSEASNNSGNISYQILAKLFFSKRIQEEVAAQKIIHPEALLTFYSDLLHQQLDLMGVTFCEVMNEINLSQVFLWLQEKSLFGEAALCFNPAPGLFFTSVDMVRNLLVSPIMSYPLADQESLFQELWCLPIESYFLGSDFNESLEKFNQTLHQFSHEKAESSGHVSKAEKTYLQVLSSRGMNHASAKTRMYITTYAKFISFVEFMTEKEKNSGEKDFELKVSRKVSSEISSFVKLKQLQDTIQGKTF